jgi:tetratricopeptide (TPR) repeat protein
MRRLLKYSISVCILFFVSSTILAQKGVEDGSKYGHGNDSVRCIRNFALCRESIKSNNYTEAIRYWRVVFKECPRSSQYIYIDGAKMYNDLIIAEKDATRKDALIDTLMMIYDQRIRYFDQKGMILGKKAVDLLRYRKDDIGSVEEAYGYLEESLNLQKNKSSIQVVAAFMSSTYFLFSAGKITDIKVIDNYSLASDLLSYIVAENPADENVRKVRENIDLKFIASGAPTCQSLISYFEPMYEEKKTNISYLKKVVSSMATLNCDEDPLYFQASEALYRLEPSAMAAFNLATLYVTREDYKKAVVYYKEAIQKETDSVKKADYYYKLSLITYAKLDDPQSACKYAQESINLLPGWGEPYILIGDAYVAGKNCFTDEFEKTTIYWAAIDKYIQAKSIDPSVSEKATERIQTCSMYFPDVETLFFYSLKDGDPYTVGCWINEKTIVRSR